MDFVRRFALVSALCNFTLLTLARLRKQFMDNSIGWLLLYTEEKKNKSAHNRGTSRYLLR